jgi:hypothetical protein
MLFAGCPVDSTGRLHAPADALREAAGALHEDLEETSTLVTLCHAVLRPDDDMVRYADAGHGLMLLVRADGSVHRDVRGDLPLGVLPGVDWHEAKVVLGRGDVVLAFSDGLLDLYPGTLPHALDALTDADRAELARRRAKAACWADEARALGRRSRRGRGQEQPTGSRPSCAMIAAVALARGLPVHTSNPDDFAGIEGLTVVPVPVPRTGSFDLELRVR